MIQKCFVIEFIRLSLTLLWIFIRTNLFYFAILRLLDACVFAILHCFHLTFTYLWTSNALLQILYALISISNALFCLQSELFRLIFALLHLLERVITTLYFLLVFNALALDSVTVFLNLKQQELPTWQRFW